MVKKTNNELVKVSGVNSRSSVETFSKYLASLALQKDVELSVNLEEVREYISDNIYSTEFNIYYLFEKDEFLFREVPDRTLLKKSTLIATPEEMEKYFDKIVESLSESEFSTTEYIQKCRDKSEDFLTNTIRFTLEKFIEYIFEDDYFYSDDFKTTYRSFFENSEYFSGDINPDIVADERLSKLFNLSLLGNHFLVDKLNYYLDSLYIGDLIHRGDDFMFFLTFFHLEEVIELSNDKLIVGQFINEIIKTKYDYKDHWCFELDDFQKQATIIFSKFPDFLVEVSEDDNLDKLISVNHYYRDCRSYRNRDLREISSCGNYGVDWCKRIVNSLSVINDKMQQKQNEHELVYKAWKRIESLFVDNISDYNKELLKDESLYKEEDNVIHSSLTGLIEFIKNHKGLTELRFIYQTNDKNKTIDIGNLPDKAFDVNYEDIYIKSYITYQKNLPIIITGFENVDIANLESRLAFYCDAIYCNNKTRKLIVPEDEVQVWKDFQKLYERGMIKSISCNVDIRGFIDSVLEQNK